MKHQPKKQHRRSTPARSAMKLLCFVLAVVLASMVAATVYFQDTLGLSGFPRDISPLTELSRLLPNLGASSGSDTIGGSGSPVVNILLIGRDAREGDEVSRSDSMILLSFNKETRKAVMTSFLRDLYVRIPGHGSNRLNAAYAYGGRELLDRTLEENFGLHVNGNIEVDFENFAGIIDVLGGVELELRQDEADFINQETGSSLTAGTQTLMGEQALMYARIRKLDADGDFSRTSRQRKMLSALMYSFRDTNVTGMVRLISQLLPLIDTDMSSIQLVRYAATCLPVLASSDPVSQSIPSAGTYQDKTIDGMAVLVADEEEVRAQLRRSLLE